MTPIQLPPWDVDSTRLKLSDLLEPRPNFAGWVGSVSADDPQKLAQFISMAKAGEIQRLMQYQEIGGNLAFAVLLNLNDNDWKLAIIESPKSPSVNERVMFSTIVHLDIPVKISKRDMTKIDQMTKDASKVSFWEVIKEWMSR